MSLSFSMQETMRGTHHFVNPTLGDAAEREFYFRITWGQTVKDFFNPLSSDFMKVRTRGVIRMAGLTNGEVPVTGELSLRYFQDQTLRYSLDFTVKGEPYTYVGTKTDVRLWRPLCLVKSHTTCYGQVMDAQGTVISKSITHFDLEPRVIVDFLTSFRLGLS